MSPLGLVAAARRHGGVGRGHADGWSDGRGPDPVDAYVRALARALRGPGRARAGLLREVRDGLDDATGGLVADGRPAGEARRLAVEEFGPVDQIAPELQRELSVLQARRTATWAALVLPALWLVWDATWRAVPDLGGASPTVMIMARATDVLGIGTALCCLVALVAFELAGARMARPEQLSRAVAITTLTGVLGIAALSASMTVLSTHDTAVLAGSSTGYRLVAVGSVLAVIVVLRSALRCVVAARVPPTG